MNKFTVPLSNDYGLPVIYISGLPALIDTGAAIPVFSIYPNLLEKAFDAKLVYDNKFVSGFGGRDAGAIYEIKNFSIGKLHFNNIEVFVPNKPKLKYPLLLSATLFHGVKYEIDTIDNILTVTTKDTDNLERDFRIKNLKGELYPQINGVLIESTDLNLIEPSVYSIELE